jgi:uncharacterized protein involved in exopolysaccharide biosynthesis
MKAPAAKRAQRYASVIIRWLVVGACVFGLTMGTGYYITNYVLPKVYTASAVLQLPLSDLETPAGTSVTPLALQPELANTLMSPELLLAVVKDLDLEKHWAERLYKTDREELPDVDALTRIERVVSFHLKRGTDLVEITAASDLPQEAADIANAVANRYLAMREWNRHDSVVADVQPGHVRIIQPAIAPTEPSTPNKGLDFIITLVAACVLSLLAASFVEMILLFVRAGEREES